MQSTAKGAFGMSVRIVAAAAVLLAGAAGKAGAQDLPAGLLAITTYEFGESREPLTAVEDRVTDAANGPDGGAALAEQLASVLHLEDATPESKRFVCRQLAIIGTPAQVDSLAPMLTDAGWADEARYALERIPGPEADAALAAALDPAPVAAMPGILASLGRRGAADYAGEIAKWTTSIHFPTAEAAIHALGLIGTAEAAGALLDHRHAVSSQLSRKVADALLLAAESLWAAGAGDKAREIYEALSGPREEAPVRGAASRGKAKIAAAQAEPPATPPNR